MPSKYKIGDHAFFNDPLFVNIQEGIIKDIKNDSWYIIDCISLPYSLTKHEEQLYATKEAYEQTLIAKNEAIQNKYASEINSEEDLICFIMKYPVSSASGEYMNYNARTVAIKKAKELLNIDIKE